MGAAVLTADPREAARRLRLRLKKRRQRAARYAAGLTASGKPVLDQGRADRRRVYAPHPAGCLCFDCLFPPDTERRPLVARFVTPYRRGDRR